jgi:F0F1-type ATP synthase membrane subunit b/b'
MEGMNEADSEYEAAIEKAHIDAEKLVEAAEAKKDKVIDHIVERIVRSGVNS